MSTVTEPVTIDELARLTGMTVRNIRAHQTRGLLPPPEIRGRTGFYGAEHVARVELIKELQAEGLNLEAIRRLVENAGGRSSAELLQFTRAVRAPFESEEPELIGLEELVTTWVDPGEDPEPELLDRAVALGLLRPLGGGRFEAPSPMLMRAGDELRALGIRRSDALAILELLRRHADGVAHSYIELFLERIWRPFDEAGQPEERWPEVRDALERLRPLAAQSLLAIFQVVMTERVDEALGRELGRAAGITGDAP